MKEFIEEKVRKDERLEPQDLVVGKHPQKMVCGMCDLSFTKQQGIAKMDCGHTFHSECAKLWIFKQKPCPFCAGGHKKTSRIRSETTDNDYF